MPEWGGEGKGVDEGLGRSAIAPAVKGCKMRVLDESQCLGGEIGRRAGFKIRFPRGSVGSTPTPGTTCVEHHIFNIGR